MYESLEERAERRIAQESIPIGRFLNRGGEMPGTYGQPSTWNAVPEGEHGTYWVAVLNDAEGRPRGISGADIGTLMVAGYKQDESLTVPAAFLGSQGERFSNQAAWYQLSKELVEEHLAAGADEQVVELLVEVVADQATDVVLAKRCRIQFRTPSRPVERPGLGEYAVASRALKFFPLKRLMRTDQESRQ